jgi:hypothetical protein
MRTRTLQIFAVACAKRAAAPAQYYFAPVTCSWSNLRLERLCRRCVEVPRAPVVRGVTASARSSHDRFDDGLAVFDDDVEINLLVSVLLAELALGISKARGESVL